MSYSHKKITVACEQCGYFDRDGVIGHLGVQLLMENKGSLFLCFYMR